ncbi:MAG: hypothetical protein MW690_001335 [Methanophagales archaeon]|nr:hypothetical protein [Methanophagales archaeon]
MRKDGKQETANGRCGVRERRRLKDKDGRHSRRCKRGEWKDKRGEFDEAYNSNGGDLSGKDGKWR